MSKILIFLAEGFEEIELVTPLDVWRRAGLQVELQSCEESLDVRGSHDLILRADTFFESESPADAIFIPGGAGAWALAKKPAVRTALEWHYHQDHLITAICAAPTIVLDEFDLFHGHSFTSHPEVLPRDSSLWKDEEVVESGPFITSQGPATALPFALKVVERLLSPQVAQDLAQQLLLSKFFPHR